MNVDSRERTQATGMLQIGTDRRSILRTEQKRQKLLKSLHNCDFKEALTMNAILAVAVTAREVGIIRPAQQAKLKAELSKPQPVWLEGRYRPN